MEEMYCIFCDAEAVRFVKHGSGEVTPLCLSHAEAYMTGQAHMADRGVSQAPSVVKLSDDERESVIRLSDGTYYLAPFLRRE